jgi:hypothetical protein
MQVICPVLPRLLFLICALATLLFDSNYDKMFPTNAIH